MADPQTVINEVEAAYRRYVEVFNGRDAAEIAQLYDHPHAQLVDQIGLSVVADDQAQQTWHDFVFSYLDGEGWDHTEIAELQIWPLSPDVAQLHAHVVRHSPDGSVLNEARANYLLRRRDDGWKVVVTLPLVADGFDGPGWPVSS